MNFYLTQSLSKNKASIGDSVILDGKALTVTAIGKKTITLNDQSYYPRNMFNRWVRMHYHNINHKTAVNNRQSSLQRTIRAWQDNFKPGSFIPQITCFSYILMERRTGDILFYFGTNKDVSSIELIEAFNKESLNQETYELLSSGKFITLPYKDELDRDQVVLFSDMPNTIKTIIIDQWNETNQHFKLRLPKD
jgi:hypothetical protein